MINLRGGNILVHGERSSNLRGGRLINKGRKDCVCLGFREGKWSYNGKDKSIQDDDMEIENDKNIPKEKVLSRSNEEKFQF